MKRAIYLFLCILTCAAFITACGKNDTDTAKGAAAQGTESTGDSIDQEATTAAEDDLIDGSDVDDDDVIDPSEDEEPGDEDISSDGSVSVTDYNDDEDDDDDEVSADPTDVQSQVKDNPTEEFQGSGTFNGFVDSSSIEVTMDDGEYQTFFVYDEDVLTQLQKLDESGSNPTIKFTYRGIDGQVNPEIIAVN